jgi:hypothetical protein
VPGESREVPDGSQKFSGLIPARSGGVLAIVYKFENVKLKLEKWFTVLKM